MKVFIMDWRPDESKMNAKMITIIPKIRKILKKPLGKIISEKEIAELNTKESNSKIIVVGDVSILNFLKKNIKPWLAIFDNKSMRKQISTEQKRILETTWAKTIRIKNERGCLNKYFILHAREFIDHGGGILIDGEEDLVALAFILVIKDNEKVVYGQPDKGLVVVEPDNNLKKKISRWIVECQ